MRVYLVSWPNGERNLVLADNDEDLFTLLDEEADPFGAEIQEIDLSSFLGLKVDFSNITYPTYPDVLPVVREFRFNFDILERLYPVNLGKK